MKWFQMDADMPSDPRIRSILEKFGNAGIGALVRLWCFIADHGNRPGWSIDSHGKPFETATLVEATGLTESEYHNLVQKLVENGHFQKTPFLKRGLIVIPAMSKRASNYEKLRRRRLGAHSTSNRRQENKTIQDSTKIARPRARSLRSPGVAAPQTEHGRSGSHCAHAPRCDTFTACIQRTISEARAERERHAQKRQS
jgi:hypothetical protein